MDTTVVGIISQKGGVGKTVTTMNLAAVTAETGLRVIVVDTDPQQSTTDWINAIGGDELPFDFIQDTNPNNLSKLRGLDHNLVLVDTPGSLTGMEVLQTVVAQSDQVVLPTTTEWLAVRAMASSISKLIAPTGTPFRVLLNRVDGGAHKEIAKAREVFAKENIEVFKRAARSYKAIYRMPSAALTITQLPDGASEAKALDDWRAIGMELLADRWRSETVDLRDPETKGQIKEAAHG